MWRACVSACRCVPARRINPRGALMLRLSARRRGYVVLFCLDWKRKDPVFIKVGGSPLPTTGGQGWLVAVKALWLLDLYLIGSGSLSMPFRSFTFYFFVRHVDSCLITTNAVKLSTTHRARLVPVLWLKLVFYFHHSPLVALLCNFHFSHFRGSWVRPAHLLVHTGGYLK